MSSFFERFNNREKISSWAKSFPAFAGRIGLLLAAFLSLEWWLMRVAKLPQHSYNNRILFLEIAKNVDLISSLLLLLIAAALAKFHYQALWQRWSSLEHGASLRRLAILIVAILAWTFSTYDFNLFFNQGHYYDRLLLVVLVAFVYWRPIFLVPFLLLIIAIVWQFNYPIKGYSVAEQFLFVRILIVLLAAFLLQAFTKRFRAVDFIFFLCCLIASSYWVPWLGKEPLHWIAQNQVHYLLPATYANGWLIFLKPETIGEITRVIATLNWPIKLFTVLVECGALFILWRRSVFLFLLGSIIVFHVGIFTITGICFWKWILLEASLFALFLNKWNDQTMPIFNKSYFALSIVLIGGAAIWFKPVALSWHDARISYTYRFEAVGESGKRYRLPPRFFAPYDYQFTLGDFAYLSSDPLLRIVWGATNRATAQALLQTTSPDQVWPLEANSGQVCFDSSKAERFDDFIKRFVSSFNVECSKRSWWSLVQPPPWLWTLAGDGAFEQQERIAKVNVVQVTSMFDDKRYLEIRKRKIREIEIPL